MCCMVSTKVDPCSWRYSKVVVAAKRRREDLGQKLLANQIRILHVYYVYVIRFKSIYELVS